MFLDKIHIFLQHLIPQHPFSRLIGWMINCRQPWLKNRIIDGFVRYYQVDMSCAIQPDPHQYPNFNSFFTRKLKPEARPIAEGSDLIVSPVDGTISQIGMIEEDSLLQAKGFTYGLQALLGGSAERVVPFKNGHFATLYLAPKDYHRIHMPFSGKLREMIYVPGQLFSVNGATTNGVPNLFARNERVVAIFDTAAGPMAVILVGAMLVASISTVWEGIITPVANQELREWRYSEQKIELRVGDEMGCFQLGSTVIVLFGPNAIHWDDTMHAGKQVCYGQAIGKKVLRL